MILRRWPYFQSWDVVRLEFKQPVDNCGHANRAARKAGISFGSVSRPGTRKIGASWQILLQFGSPHT